MKDFNYYLESIGEIGYVEQITSAIVSGNGLPGVKPGELVLFENGTLGETLSINQDSIEILLFSKNGLTSGTKMVRTNEFLKIPVGPELLGKIIDPLGNNLEGDIALKTKLEKPITTNPTGITTRKTIKRHLSTGAPVVDLILPLGYGQKQLVIGDRKVGKTDFLIQTVLTQANMGNICVYASIGKRKIDIKKLKELLAKFKILNRVVIVGTGSEDPVGMIYLTPYSAMTISEFFRDQGFDVLLVLDDLSTHAKFYREISLLGKRFPGRNSYPGDIFFTHAKLLERAGNFITSKGEKSITCLPVVESTQGDLSGYIQTNIASMTDGHLYFDTDLFAKGRRPAINPFISVTRVGRQTQSSLKRDINRELLSFLTIYEKMQNFSHFGAELNEGIKSTLDFGEKLTAFLDQPLSTITPLSLQIILFAILWNNKIQNTAHEPIGQDLQKIVNTYNTNGDIKKIIDGLVENTASFNNLLAVIRDKGQELLQSLKS